MHGIFGIRSWRLAIGEEGVFVPNEAGAVDTKIRIDVCLCVSCLFSSSLFGGLFGDLLGYLLFRYAEKAGKDLICENDLSV